MYLKNVNRGMSFTKAGVYTTGLVIVLGLLATSSGSNAFFIALGFGLSLLTISGLLSERSMKNFRFLRLGSAVAESGKAFSIRVTVENESRSWFLFGVETLALTTLPRFPLLNAKIKALMQARLLSLAPGETRQIQGRFEPMERGYYDRFIIVQRTLFPFGLISKFKVSQTQASVLVRPAVLPEFLQSLRDELHAHLMGQSHEDEFHSHRLMHPRDSRSGIDWKRSAGKPPNQWVIKTFQSQAQSTHLRIRCDWSELKSAKSNVDYERFISRLHTACEAVALSGQIPLLEMGDGKVIASMESCVEWMTRLPLFDDRNAIEWKGREWAAEGWILELGLDRHVWRQV